MKRHLNFVELGNYLKGYRLKSGLSQMEVATQLGYSNAQFVSNFERGLCSPPFPKLKILIELYQIPIVEITELLIQIQRQVLEDAFTDKPSAPDSSGRRTKKKSQSNH